MPLPAPPPSPPLTWRPLRAEDVPAWSRLLEACEAVDATGEIPDPDELADEFDSGWADAEGSSLAAFDDAGVMVAFGWAQLHGPPEGARDDGAVHLWGGVHPEHRGQGLGRFLVGWQLARSQQRAAAFRGGIPVQAVFNVDDRHEDRLALADAFGFSPGRNFYEMRRDLGEPIPDLPLAEGLRFQGWSDAVNEPTRAAYNAAFAGHWGSQERDADSWNRYFTGHRFFRPDLSRVVMAADDVAAFAVSAVYPQDAALKGYTEGWVHLIGVRPGFRGRGLGAALLAEALRVFAADGLEYATLDVDTDNATGALRLYERLGFAVQRRQIRFVLPLNR